MAIAPRLMRSPATQQFLLGQSLSKQAADQAGQPVYATSQGLARIAQALGGALLQNRAQKMFKEEQAADAANLASMLGGAGVDPNLAQLFGSSVPGAPQVGAALLQGQQAADLALIQANAKAKTATVVSGDSEQGRQLGIPRGQSAAVTFNNQGVATDIGKPFDSNLSTFPGTSSTSGAMNVVARGAKTGETDTAEYAVAYALLGKPRTIVMPDGRKIDEPGMDLSGFPAPTFGAQTPATQTPSPPTAPPVPVPEAPAEQPTSAASQEQAEPSPEGVPVDDITVAADKEYVTKRLPQFREDEAKAIVNLGKLDKVVSALGNRDDLTGITPAIGLKLGEIFGLPGAFAPTASDVQNRILSVAQESIKQIMGAQFAEKEGENVLRRAYDASQPEAVNIKRVRELISSLEVVVKAQRDEAEYFEKHNTLRGYVGPSREELENIVRMGAGGDAVKTLEKGETIVINGVEVRRTN